MSDFPGFPKESFAFLKGIAAHNEKAWFEAHRDLYDAGYLAPAKAFVAALGPTLKALSPRVQYEAKINGSMQRINRDIRFSKDKRPYKDHLDLWFWHGERRSWDAPGFWFRLGPGEVYLGTGMFSFGKEQLDLFRQSVIHPRSGRALLTAVAAVEKKRGVTVHGKTRKLLPRGFTAEPDRIQYLLHEGLYASVTLPMTAAAETEFVDLCARHYKAMWPIGQWLLAEVTGE